MRSKEINWSETHCRNGSDFKRSRGVAKLNTSCMRATLTHIKIVPCSSAINSHFVDVMISLLRGCHPDIVSAELRITGNVLRRLELLCTGVAKKDYSVLKSKISRFELYYHPNYCLNEYLICGCLFSLLGRKRYLTVPDRLTMRSFSSKAERHQLRRWNYRWNFKRICKLAPLSASVEFSIVVYLNGSWIR